MDVIWFARTKNCLQCQQVNWQDEKCANCAIKTFIFSLKILLLHIFNLYHFVDATHSQNGENENERKPERARKKNANVQIYCQCLTMLMALQANLISNNTFAICHFYTM